MITINKMSCEFNKSLNIPDTILKYYFYFNGLSEECNIKMKMNSYSKSIILLGKYKLYYEKNKIIFKNDTKEIIIYGSFIKNNNNIYYNKNNNIKYSINLI